MMRGLPPFATPPWPVGGDNSANSPQVQPDFGPAAAAARGGHVQGMRAPTALAALLALFAPPAMAGVDELRLGLSAHDISFLGHGKEDGIDGNAEVLFDSPAFLDVLWAPRPHVGLSVNSVGDTSQLYAGLTWSVTPFERVFIEFSLGGAVHDGTLSSSSPSDKQLGSRALFRESLSLGFRIDERNSVSVMFDHESNAGLAEHNAGLNNLGVRWGYRF